MNKEQLDAAMKILTQDPSYSAYTKVANVLDKLTSKDSGFNTLNLAVLRNFTLEPLVPVFKGEISLSGFNPQVYLGGYDTIAQDVFDANSELYRFKPELIFLFQWLETLGPDLVTRFSSLSESDINEEIERIVLGVRQFISAIRNNTKAPIVFNNFVLPAFPTLGILDAQSGAHQMQAFIKLNLQLSELTKEFPDVYLIDVMGLMARLGSLQGIDERYWQLGRAPIGRNALVPLGREFGKFVRALFGRVRKCLVLDCDNVLWSGILGEEGIKSVNQVFQTEVLNLHDRGVILALCSKNNEQDVLDVLKDKPEMVLREKHIAAWQINWDDKVTNLKRIAKELNIGLDSLVFVDDSPFECDLVRERLPEVAVVCMSGDPSLFNSKLQEQGYFDTLTISDEDKRRNQMYREESERKNMIASMDTMEEYLSSLNMIAEIGLADDATIPRIAQLTQKTNQFNLTTNRYTEADIQNFVTDSKTQVLYLKLVDHVSDIGLVGTAIIQYNDNQAIIDTLLLSCRALGRGVEDAFMINIIRMAESRGCEYILGQFKATAKNAQVSKFYERLGFVQIKESEQGSDWRFSLENDIKAGPQWIKINIKQEVEYASQ